MFFLAGGETTRVSRCSSALQIGYGFKSSLQNGLPSRPFDTFLVALRLVLDENVGQ